ncbi:MAG TPA: family 1 glycosylhydrolase [Allosphingosinicella sp.]|jgi:beta-glucosidase/6-phospho-beta-glucosidase/beta-galactosidase
MIRVISYWKAILAGVAGAFAWEILARLLRLAGLPFFDIVRMYGTLIADGSHPLLWWPVGMAVHAGAGALWAIFYAYFFWSVMARPPAQQGLVFAIGPALITVLILRPQLELMHAHGPAPGDYAGLFGLSGGWQVPLSILVAYALYGVVMGSLYTRPVGAPAGKKRLPALRAPPPSAGRDEDRDRNLDGFMFATGIECSYPTLDGGRWRMDEMAMCGHYRHWKRDLELVRALGINYLRYGPPLHEIYRGPGRYDWTFMDAVAGEMRRLGIRPIIDFCHFGVPDWLENFQNRQVPEMLAAYAGAFVERYPWITHYTPINEMYVCARLSALEGLWNEQCRDERSFVTAACNLARAAVLITQQIRRHCPEAIFIANESSEFYQACCPDEEIRHMAEFENQRRFVPLDLYFARTLRGDIRDFMFDNGMTKEDYNWFLQQPVPERTILGVDYYDWNEKVIEADHRARSMGELFGWYVIVSQYFRRYRRMVMHTETNYRNPRGSALWLWRQWHNVERIREAGVPVVGFTWYSLTDQIDWGIAVSAPIGNVTPVGLFDLNRDLRSVGLAYKQLIEMYRGKMPVEPQWGELKDLPALVPEPGAETS